MWVKLSLLFNVYISDTQKDTYEHAKASLKERFEPSSKKDLYLAELMTRKRGPAESWFDYAEELRRLAVKAYPDLDSLATEQIALTHFMSNIMDPQVSFAVKQALPKSLDDAVTTTLKVETYQSTSRMNTMPVQVVHMPSATPNDVTMNAVGWKAQESRLEQLLGTLNEKLDHLTVHNQP